MFTERSRSRRRRPISFIAEALLLEERCLLSIDLTMNAIVPRRRGVSIGDPVLASFTFDQGGLADYSAEIAWGDGTTSVGQISAGAGGSGNISGDHVYAATGPNVLGITVVGDADIGAGRETLAVIDPPPMAHADSYTIPHGMSLTAHASSGTAPYGVLYNDIDPDGGTLTAALVSSVQHGTLAFNADGTFTYTPSAGFTGKDGFTYQAQNATNTSPDTSVTIDVVENRPVAGNDAFSVTHGQVLTQAAYGGVLNNDTDPDGDVKTATLVSSVQHGTLAFNADGSFTCTPNAGSVGIDSFTYQASDGLSSSGIASVVFDVEDTHAPVAANQSYTVPHDTTLTVASESSGVLANASDADGDPLTAVLVDGPREGALKMNADGTFTYVPNAGYYGTDSFTYQASDGALLSGAATVTIAVVPTGSTVPLVPESLYTDDFSADTLDPSWQAMGGTWSIASGTLSQTSTDAGGAYKLLNDTVFPADIEITAQVQINSWSGDVSAWAGVGLDSDPVTGAGYNLVFHGDGTVAFLDENTGAWGTPYAFSWSVGTWYNFAMEAVGTDLYGSVWAVGTSQPSTWMFEQSGWSDATGAAPALDGGTGGSATASFQDVAITYAPDAPADFDAPPIIDAPASASETDVTGSSTELTVSAEDPNGDNANLTYDWTVLSAPDGAFNPVLSDNDSATANDVTAQFTMAGSYTFMVVVSDGGASTTSAVSVNVEQTATSLSIKPVKTVIEESETVQYTATAYDQFGNPMDPKPTINWSVSGPGEIDASGVYTAPDDETGTATIQAHAGDVPSTLGIFIVDLQVIDFDNLPAGTIVSNEYPQATFSGDPTYPNQIVASTDASQPNTIGAPTPASDGGDYLGNPYIHPLYIDFTTSVDDLTFLQMRDNAPAGALIAQVNLYQDGGKTTTVPVYSTGGFHVPGTVDLSAYDHIVRIEIVNVIDPGGIIYDNFRFKVATDLLTAHRAGDFQGQAVSDDVKNSGDPSQYTVLVDDDYVQSDGTPALDSQTAELPSGGQGDSDLAQISLSELPSGMTKGSVQLVLSDPGAVRLFKSDGTLLYDKDQTGDAPLTLDLSDPSGYLAGLQSGDLDVWLEAVHPDTDFSFTIVYKDGQGDVSDFDTVHMALADWTFRDYDGMGLAAITPIWEPPLLANLEQAVASGTQGKIGEEPQDSTFKNQVVGLGPDTSAQLVVASTDNPSDSYVDDLDKVAGGRASHNFGAVYSSDDIVGADPDTPMTPAQMMAALNVIGLQLLDGTGTQSTLTIGPTGGPTDHFTRYLVSPGPLTIQLNNPNGIYHVGDTVTAVVTETRLDGRLWRNGLDAVLTDEGKPHGNPTGTPGQFVYNFLLTDPGYLTFTVNNSTFVPKPAQRDFSKPVPVAGDYTNSVTIMVLPTSQGLSIWQQQAWQALATNGVVTGNVVNRNRQITTIYVNLFNFGTETFSTNPQPYEWAGVAAFASYLAGVNMAKAANAWTITSDAAGVLGLDTTKLLDYLGQGNIAIFMDMYPQMLAYQAGGLDNIRILLGQGVIIPLQFEAWSVIDQGFKNQNKDDIYKGTNLLAQVEQTVTLQKIMNKDLGLWKTLTDRSASWVMLWQGIPSPVPGDDSTFQSAMPGMSFGNGQARYQWFLKTMVPAWKDWRVKFSKIDVPTLMKGGYSN